MKLIQKTKKFSEIEGSYGCVTDGCLAPAGALLGLDQTTNIQHESNHPNTIYVDMRSGITALDTTPITNSRINTNYLP